MRPRPDPWKNFWLTGSVRDYLAACRRDPPQPADFPAVRPVCPPFDKK